MRGNRLSATFVARLSLPRTARIDRFHVTSQLFPPPYWCTAFNCVINANTTQIYNSGLLSDMDVSKCEQKSDEKPDLSSLRIADYAKKLEPLVK